MSNPIYSQQEGESIWKENMKGLFEVPDPVPPPIPPPPPPKSNSHSSSLSLLPTSISPLVMEQLRTGDESKLVEEMKQIALKERAALTRHRSNSEQATIEVLTVAHLVQPILQQGPMCGLVALQMAAEHLAPTLNPQEILDEARRKCYTKSGEMFSVYDMANLAIALLKCDAIVMRTDNEIHEIINCLLDGSFILVPYDADYNHSPTLRNGHSAHWALLVGFTLFIDDGSFIAASFLGPSPSSAPAESESQQQISPAPVSVCFKDSSTLNDAERQKIRECLRSIPTNHIYVNARQGKSAHVGLWKISDLLKSNSSLKEVAPKIVAKPNDFILSDIDNSLCSQVIILRGI